MARTGTPVALGLAVILLGSAAAACTFLFPGAAAGKAPQPHNAQLTDRTVQPASQQLPVAFTSAEEQAEDWLSPLARWVGAGLIAGMVAASFSAPVEAYSSGYNTFSDNTKSVLEPCKDSKKFKKRIKDEIFKSTQRQKKYPNGSVVWNRFADKIASIKVREANYGERLCGKRDGLPRVLVNPEVVRGGVVIPALMFLYTTGWIGWAGRSYLVRTRNAQKEMNIDVPLALTCMASGFAWPVNAWQAIVNGEMVEKDEDIQKSLF